MAIDVLTLQFALFIGIVVGSFGRMMLPYLQKLKEAEDSETEPPVFKRKYIFTMVYSLALSGVAAMTLFPTIATSIKPDVEAVALPGMFFTAILAGWGANSIINNIITMKSGGAPIQTKTDTEDNTTSTTTVGH